MKRLLIISVIIIISVSCRKENRWDCFKGAGDIVTEERYTEEFTVLEIYDIFNIYITSDTVHKVILEGGKNLLSSVTTDISGNRLVIHNNNKCNWVRDYNKIVNLYISVASLKEIYMYGGSSVNTLDQLNTDTLEINVWSAVSFFDLDLNCDASFFKVHAGTGTFRLRGNTDFSYIWSHGTGHLFADSFYSSETMIYNISTGDCHVNASDKLIVFITSTGNIYYTGDPEIEIREISSTGELIHKN